MDKLPNNIIIKILHQNKINKQNDMYKKRHNLFIKYLDYHFNNTGNVSSILDQNIRTDCQFLEYEDMWGTSFEKAIEQKWGKEWFNDFLDNYF